MGKTLTQKIFDAHRVDTPCEGMNVLSIDRVMCHEITTPMAINDLVARGMDKIFDKNKILAVIDHVTPSKDTKSAEQAKVLREWARRHMLPHWFDIGANGVCHAIFPEKGLIRPGFTVIMGDSHTCTHGAFGAFAAGVGTTDLEVGILKGICSFRDADTIKVTVTGTLPRHVYAKDVILKVIKELTVNGATDCVIEFHGPVVAAMSMEARMTMCNMAIEAGGTSGVCMPDMTTVEYLWPFIKDEYKTKDAALKDFSRWVSDADAPYVKTLTVDVSKLTPQVTVGFKPDQVKDVKEVAGTRIDQVYIGSCTNGRIEDLRVAAAILKGKKIAPTVRGIVSPATPAVYSQANAEGLIDIFMAAGFCVTNPTCGACLGMSNGVLAPGEACASTTNRNFNGRMGKGGMVHLMSPATAAASALAGVIADPTPLPLPQTTAAASTAVKATGAKQPRKASVAAKKSPAKKAPAKKATPMPAAKKVAAKKAVAKKVAAKSVISGKKTKPLAKPAVRTAKATVKKAAKPVAKKAVAKAARKASPAKKAISAKKAAAAKSPAKKVMVKKVTAKKPAAKPVTKKTARKK